MKAHQACTSLRTTTPKATLALPERHPPALHPRHGNPLPLTHPEARLGLRPVPPSTPVTPAPGGMVADVADGFEEAVRRALPRERAPFLRRERCRIGGERVLELLEELAGRVVRERVTELQEKVVGGVPLQHHKLAHRQRLGSRRGEDLRLRRVDEGLVLPQLHAGVVRRLEEGDVDA
eukprot:scaffold830_cov112-Isochrysis_galbana.AAC.2